MIWIVHALARLFLGSHSMSEYDYSNHFVSFVVLVIIVQSRLMKYIIYVLLLILMECLIILLPSFRLITTITAPK